MTDDLWRRVEEVYYEVSSCPPDRWAGLLDQSCSGDAELRREVESLLAARHEAGDFLSELFHQATRLGSAAPAVGSKIGDYEILGPIGAGAMGEVFRARDTRLGRDVALKVLHAHLTYDEARVMRFQAEARAAATLNHPNIVTIYDVGQSAGTWFIASELIQGVTLRDRLRAAKLSPEETLAFGIQCADALAAAHRAGIVHRDIKPENIMVRADGVVKVVDFGLARMLAPRPEWALEATPTGSVMGTPRYMSPEQARGQTPDARSDIFSLGAVLFEMAAGRPAFPGTSPAEVFVSLLGSETDMVGAGPFAPVISRALKKDREARYQTIERLAADLRQIDPKAAPSLAARLTRAIPAGLVRAQARQAAVVVLALAVPVAGMYAWISRRSRPPDAALKFTTLTTFGGSKSYPAFSPDGTRIAFAWKSSNNDAHHIYVMTLASGGGPIQLSFSSEDDTFPAWSPDGEQIAFCRRIPSPDERAPVPYGIYLVPARGGAERKVADGWAGVSWSADGKTLAVARVPNSGGIELLSLESGARRRLTNAREDLHPVFSPNGKWIAFIRVLSDRGRGRDIFAVPANGGQPRRLTSDAEYITGATWTADSQEIVFSSPRDRAQGSFWRVPVSGGASRPVSAALRDASFPSIARQGSRMAFTESGWDSNLHLYTGPGYPDGGARWRFDSRLGVVLSSGTEHTAVFSPDGGRFAFVSDRSGSNQIWVARRDGSEATQLTFLGKETTGSPRWSPDGAWIAFDVWASNESNIYVVSSQGGAPRLLKRGESWSPSWSPDGGWVYFSSDRSGVRNIWKMPSSGGDAIQVTHNGAQEGRPSPDGAVVYFRKNTPTGCCAIWYAPAGGGPEKPVPELEKFATVSRSWGVVQRGIFFLARENGPRQTVRFLNFGSHEVTDVLRLEKEPDWSFPGVAMSPDGRDLLAVQIDRDTNDLMMIENFR
jgi:Tol biopolymer transport system component